MTKPRIGVLLLFAVTVSAGCNKGKADVKESAAVNSSAQSKAKSDVVSQRDPLVGIEVQVAKSFVSQDGIRAILVQNEITGKDIILRCNVKQDDGSVNYSCPQPRLKIKYTLEAAPTPHWYLHGCSDGSYWMKPEDHHDYMKPDDGQEPDVPRIAVCLFKP